MGIRWPSILREWCAYSNIRHTMRAIVAQKIPLYQKKNNSDVRIFCAIMSIIVCVRTNAPCSQKILNLKKVRSLNRLSPIQKGVYKEQRSTDWEPKAKQKFELGEYDQLPVKKFRWTETQRDSGKEKKIKGRNPWRIPSTWKALSLPACGIMVNLVAVGCPCSITEPDIPQPLGLGFQ